MAAQVRLVFEFLDVEPVAAGVDPPVDVAGIVPEGVLAILRELDGEAVIGTAVNPLPESLDDRLGAQLHRLDLHQGRRIDQALGPADGGVKSGWNRSIFHLPLFSLCRHSRLTIRVASSSEAWRWLAQDRNDHGQGLRRTLPPVHCHPERSEGSGPAWNRSNVPRPSVGRMVTPRSSDKPPLVDGQAASRQAIGQPFGYAAAVSGMTKESVISSPSPISAGGPRCCRRSRPRPRPGS